jgi:uncharacterized membrane protein
VAQNEKAMTIPNKPDKMLGALDRVRTALNDWCADYAHDFCDEKDVEAARVRLHERGLLSYIAEALAAQNVVRTGITELQAALAELTKERDRLAQLTCQCVHNAGRAHAANARAEAAEARVAELAKDARRLDYIEHTFSGMTNRERYLPVQMIWGKGCNGRTLRDACDKYMKRDAAIDALAGQP